MVSHHVRDIFHRNLLGRLHEEGESFAAVVTHGVFDVVVCVAGHKIAVFVLECEFAVAEDVECRPCAGFAASHPAEIKGCVCVAKTEFAVFSAEIAHFPCKGNHVRGIEAVFRVIERECADSRLVGMCADISVRHPAGHPDYSLADIFPVFFLVALADEVHYPYFILVGDREGFSGGIVAVCVGEVHDYLDGFACRPCPLQCYIDE